MAALLGNRQQDPLQSLLLMKMFEKDGGKKDEHDKKKEESKSWTFLGFEIKQKKKESAGSLVMWVILALLSFSTPVSILQDWIEHSLRAALQ